MPSRWPALSLFVCTFTPCNPAPTYAHCFFDLSPTPPLLPPQADRPRADADAANSAPPGAPSSPAELTLYVQQLLQAMQTRFADLSDTLISRIDEMGNKIEELERNLGNLIHTAGQTAPAGVVPSGRK